MVAAGNESTNAALSSPANYDEVITVSALADFKESFAAALLGEAAASEAAVASENAAAVAAAAE